MKINLNKLAFTFLELVVTITVLLILWTMWIVSYMDFLPTSRDTTRISHLAELEKTFNDYKKIWKYPMPDKKISIMVDNELAWYQWYLSEDILKIVWYSWVDWWFDSKDLVYYSYYVSRDFRKFQIMAYLEKDYNSILKAYINKTNANDTDYLIRYPYMVWDRLGIIVDLITNIPIQELVNINTQGYINFTWSLTWNYKLYIKNWEIFSSMDNSIIWEKIKELAFLKNTKVTGTGTVLNTLHMSTTWYPFHTINSVSQSSDLNLWFSTNSWIWFFDWINWLMYDKDNTILHNNIVYYSSQDSLWRMWFGTNQWVYILSWSTWSALNVGNSLLLHNNISTIYTWSDWKMWFGTNGWISVLDSWTWTDYTKNWNWLISNHINTIYEDSLWNMWFWTDQWLNKFKNWIVLATYKTAQWLGDNRISYITEDSANNLWVGTRWGASKYNWTSFVTKNKSNTFWWLVDDEITYIYLNQLNGDLWFWTADWASKYSEATSTWTVYNTLNYLQWNNVYLIWKNNSGNILIVNDWGIDIIP